MHSDVDLGGNRELHSGSCWSGRAQCARGASCSQYRGAKRAAEHVYRRCRIRASDFGTIGVVVIGVIIMSSEYARNAQKVGRSRQLTTTMVAVPRRFRAVTSKIVVLCMWVIVTSVVATAVTIITSRHILGEYASPLDGACWRRVAGVSVFWVMMALISCAFTAVTRSGVLPLAVLLANSTVLSFSRLLSLVTDSARYLPDTAALSTFLVESPVTNAVDAVTGFYLCAAWALLAVVIIVVSWVTRDAQS